MYIQYSLLCFYHAAKTTIIIGGQNSSGVGVATVEYYGPQSITIPPLSAAAYLNSAVYINGTLYSCGGFTSRSKCNKYNLAANSSSWENMTNILTTKFEYSGPLVAFDEFFWYFGISSIMQVPVNGSHEVLYHWQYGATTCVVGNGTHTVVVKHTNSSVLMNTDSSSPTNWTTVVYLNTPVYACGCLWFGNTIYVTGGVNASFEVLNTTQLINTDTFELTLGAPLPVAVGGHRMGVIDGKPAVIGGTDGLNYFSDIYVLCRGTWILSEQSLPGGLAFFGSVTF